MTLTYEETLGVCMARFGLSILEAKRMRPCDFEIYMTAYKVKQNEITYHNAQLAWFNQAVQSTTGSSKNPKPKYRNFDEFFNQEKQFNSLFKNGHKPSKRQMNLADRNRMMNNHLKERG